MPVQSLILVGGSTRRHQLWFLAVQKMPHELPNPKQSHFGRLMP
jgi:hypothetical protein